MQELTALFICSSAKKSVKSVFYNPIIRDKRNHRRKIMPAMVILLH